MHPPPTTNPETAALFERCDAARAEAVQIIEQVRASVAETHRIVKVTREMCAALATPPDKS